MSCAQTFVISALVVCLAAGISQAADLPEGTSSAFCANGFLGIDVESSQTICCAKRCGGCSADDCTVRTGRQRCCPAVIAKKGSICTSESSTACVVPSKEASPQEEKTTEDMTGVEDQAVVAEAQSIPVAAAAGCVDTYPACPGWGAGQCATPGVATWCPCMCSGGGPTPPPPSGGCTDTYAACPGWVGQCAVPGVAQQCPCMCGGTASPAPPPSAGCKAQPAAVANGNAFACTLPAGSSTVCTGSCKTGFTGTPTATCSAAGTWSVTGTCVRAATCASQPVAVANGNAFSCTLPANSATVCATTCKAGFSGTPTATCGTTGTWAVTGTCTRQTSCRAQPAAVANGNAFACTLPASSSTVCTGSCKAGFTGSPTATCSAAGTWSVTGTCAAAPQPPSGESAAGISKDLFTKVFAGDTDKCGSACPGYSANPNTQAVIDKHWGFFKSAAATQGFSLQNLNEASIFFGTIKHEYGGNLNQMIEFCGRKGEVCNGYGNYYGRGPVQLSWDYNYRYVKTVVGRDIETNPALVADSNSDLGWQTAMIFWTDSNLNCAGMWSNAGVPTCPDAARAGNLADVTKRINPRECAGGDQAASQPARIQQVQSVRSLWGLPALSKTSC